MGLRLTLSVLVWACLSLPALAAVAPQESYGPSDTPSPSDVSAPLTIREVRFSGNLGLEDSRLQAAFGIAPGATVTRAGIRDGLKRLDALGYFQNVAADLEPVKDGHRLVVSVVENPSVEAVVLEGVTRLDAASARTLFDPVKGPVMNARALEAASKTLQQRYREAGYPLARISAVERTPDGTLRLRVSEGRIYAIRLRGNTATRDEVILRELSARVGRVAETYQLDLDRRRLQALDLFETVDVTAEPPPASHPDEVVLVYELKEKQTGEVELGGDLDPRSGGFQGTLTLSQNNLFGWGQHAHARLALSQQLQLIGDISYSTNWLGDQRFGLAGNLYARRFNNFFADFREDRQGASVTTTPPFFSETPWRLQLGLRGERISLADNAWLGGAPRTDVTLSGTDADALVTGTATLMADVRDDYAYPTRGGAVTLSLDPGLLNGVNPLIRGTSAVSGFFPLLPVPWSPLPAVVALDLRGGTLQALSSRVPAYERFYATGPYLVRGWSEFPTPGTAPSSFGGSNALTGTLEVRTPIWGPASGVFFGDTGVFWDTSFRTDTFRSGYGLGLRVVTPLGPVRLDYGLQSWDRPGQFHFGLGQKF